MREGSDMQERATGRTEPSYTGQVLYRHQHLGWIHVVASQRSVLEAVQQFVRSKIIFKLVSFCLSFIFPPASDSYIKLSCITRTGRIHLGEQ